MGTSGPGVCSLGGCAPGVLQEYPSQPSIQMSSHQPKSQTQKKREIAEKRQVQELNRIYKTRCGWDEWDNVVPVLEIRRALKRIGYPCTGDQNEVEARLREAGIA